MNKKIILAAVLASYFASMGAAMAEGRHGDDRHDNGRHEGQKHEERYDDNDHDRRNDRRDYRPNEHEGRGRGAGPQHNYYKGGRLPMEYNHRQYVVEDWRGHRLSAPPRGYHWVQTGGDYVLVAITTGIIISLLLSN
jgi:Ni/Co efflux regulator RcnB